MVAATYRLLLDLNRDNLFNHPLSNLTSRLIGNINFNVGMTEADQSFAPPSKLTVTLDNSLGIFNPDTLGAEVLTNGDFSSWSGDNPTSWTVIGEVASDPQIKQVAQDQTHFVGSGAGAANFYSSSGTLEISQTALTISTTYKVVVDISAGVFNTGSLAIEGAPHLYHLPGVYTYYFTATNTAFSINTLGVADLTINSISVKPVSLYGNLINEGLLCDFVMESPLREYIGKLSNYELITGRLGRAVAVLTFTDWTLDFLDTEYIPPLYTDVTVDEPLLDTLRSAKVPVGYITDYWLMGVQGYSILDTSTILGGDAGNSESLFDTAITETAFVGDNSLDGKDGVSMQTFQRDLVGAEVYGRYFYDPHEFGYVFHNRHRDALATSAYTLTENDYEPNMSSFIKTPVLNHSTVTFQPRSTGTAGTVIWAKDESYIGLYNEMTTITARYRDVANPSARIGATDVLQLIPGTDYVIIEPQYGTDVTTSVSVSMVIGANSAEITIDNTRNTFAIHVTTLQIRGTPLKTFNQRTVFSTRRGSQVKYVTAPEQVSYPLVDTANFAQSIADFRTYRNFEPINAFRTIGWSLNKDSNRLTRGLEMTVGKRITISDSILQHTADYIVVGFRHNISLSGGDNNHDITCILKSCERESYWELDASTLGDNTRLAL